MSGWKTLITACATLLFACGFLPASAVAKDGVVEVSGIVQSMPAGGFIGTWTIAGKAVVADAATVVDQEAGKAAVGAIVEAKALQQADGSLLATRIEVKMSGPGGGMGGGMGGSDDEGELTGPIESLPADGLVGSWKVGGRTVIVLSTTRLDQERGGFVVGAIVEVHGLPDPSGAITASEIEVKSGGAQKPVMPGPGKGMEIVGVLNALPAGGLVGDWTVGERTVHVTATTVLDDEGKPFAVGETVEVHGMPDSAGAITATKVERVEGNGAPVPALHFWGAIESMPDGAAAPIGLWKIAGRLVNVSAATRLHQENAPLVVGGIAEVSGWPQPDGVVEAHEIESRKAVGVLAGAGPKAIEFANESLGHFFVTAFPPEIAALDAGAFGGAWKRTGESFNVGGGAAAVCRFYGMPPLGPDSHFFTVDAQECGKVMRDYRAWTFEAHAFSITEPVGGVCPEGTLAVHRFYNNPSQGKDMNHRYVVSDAIAVKMRGLGWIDEGVVMCAAR